MKNSFWLLPSCLLFIVACNSNTIAPGRGNEAKDTLQVKIAAKRKLSLIDTGIIRQIISSYKDEYSNLVPSEERDDSAVTLSFRNSDSERLCVTYIPLFSNGGPCDDTCLTGDLDGDGLDEIICTVHTLGGGAGGNISWNDIFVFKQVNGNYKILCDQTAGELCGCKNTGILNEFYPEKIEHGIITGRSVCYAEGDAHCCPSLSYMSTAKLVKSKLVFVGNVK